MFFCNEHLGGMKVLSVPGTTLRGRSQTPASSRHQTSFTESPGAARLPQGVGLAGCFVLGVLYDVCILYFYASVRIYIMEMLGKTGLDQEVLTPGQGSSSPRPTIRHPEAVSTVSWKYHPRVTDSSQEARSLPQRPAVLAGRVPRCPGEERGPRQSCPLAGT